MPQILTSIEINAAPAVVREKFLKFEDIPKYHSAQFKSLEPQIPGKPLVPGDRMVNDLNGTVFRPIVLASNETEFRWRGSLYGLFVGEHYFQFESSKNTPGGTTFVHGETFSGVLGGAMGEGWVAKKMGAREKTEGGFRTFNEDLKRWIEGESK